MSAGKWQYEQQYEQLGAEAVPDLGDLPDDAK